MIERYQKIAGQLKKISGMEPVWTDYDPKIGPGSICCLIGKDYQTCGLVPIDPESDEKFYEALYEGFKEESRRRIEEIRNKRRKEFIENINKYNGSVEGVIPALKSL